MRFGKVLQSNVGSVRLLVLVEHTIVFIPNSGSMVRASGLDYRLEV